MNGKDWNKNDTSYYGVYHTADDGDWWGWIDNLVTNNFGEWLKRKNKSRVDEGQETYDVNDFWLEKVEVFSREQAR